MNQTAFPGIDELIKLAESDPQALEILRKQWCDHVIDSAPERYHQRLKGIQFQVDMQRRKSNNSLHSCIKISEMMMQSYEDLQTVLSQLNKPEQRSAMEQMKIPATSCADVIPLFPERKNA